MKLKFVSFDPSLSNLGVAFMTYDTDTQALELESIKLVHTEPTKQKTLRKNSDDLDRCRLLHLGMAEACKGRAMAFAEVPHGSQSARAMMSYGACLMLLASCPIPLIQVSESEAKMAAHGRKSATKREMIEWATERYPYANWLTRTVKGKTSYIDANEHPADACAAALAGINTDQFKQATAMFSALSA